MSSLIIIGTKPENLIEMSINKDEILNLAIVEYGVVPQIDQFHEEVGEIIQALNKVKRLGGMLDTNSAFIAKPHKQTSIKYSLAYYALCSEVADLKIMLAQLEKMLDKEAIDIAEDRKLQRLLVALQKNIKSSDK